MDLQLPKLGGVDAILKIRADVPAARFIVLTTFDGDEDIYRAPSMQGKGLSSERNDCGGTALACSYLNASKLNSFLSVFEGQAELVASLRAM
jgi:DNA-binding NarL/FixJ family response regulator